MKNYEFFMLLAGIAIFPHIHTDLAIEIGIGYALFAIVCAAKRK